MRFPWANSIRLRNKELGAASLPFCNKYNPGDRLLQTHSIAWAITTNYTYQQLLQVCLTKCKPSTKPKGASPNSTAQSSSNQGQALNCWKDTLVCYSHYSHYWVTTVSVDGPEDYDKWSKPLRWDHRVIPSMMICESPFHLPAVWLPFLRNSMQLEGQFLDQQDSHHQKTSWQEPL